MNKTEFRTSQQSETEIGQTEQKLTISQFLFCFSDEPSETWVRASRTLWFIHPIPAQWKFIPFSTWPCVGKTFHPGVFLYLNRSKTSSRLITANKVAQRTIRFYFSIKTSFKVDTEGWYCVKKGRNTLFSSLLLCFRSADSLSVNFMSGENWKWKFTIKKNSTLGLTTKLNSCSNWLFGTIHSNVFFKRVSARCCSSSFPVLSKTTRSELNL